MQPSIFARSREYDYILPIWYEPRPLRSLKNILIERITFIPCIELTSLPLDLFLVISQKRKRISKTFKTKYQSYQMFGKSEFSHIPISKITGIKGPFLTIRKEDFNGEEIHYNDYIKEEIPLFLFSKKAIIITIKKKFCVGIFCCRGMCKGWIKLESPSFTLVSAMAKNPYIDSILERDWRPRHQFFFDDFTLNSPFT